MIRTSKPSVHIMHDRSFNTSIEAINYANEKGYKITHIDKYFMKGAFVFNYKFTREAIKNNNNESNE